MERHGVPALLIGSKKGSVPVDALLVVLHCMDYTVMWSYVPDVNQA